MDLSEHRREYAAFCAASERARYEHHAGLTPALDLAPARERYADLWRRERIEDLKRAEEQTPAQFETERAGVRALRRAAELQYLDASTREVSAELERCAAASHVDWNGLKLTTETAASVIASEPDAARRGELAARLADASAPCDDLRAARLEASAEASRSLGYADARAHRESLSGTDLSALAAGAKYLLERTARAYEPHLAEWVARENFAHERGGVSGSRGGPTRADALYFERAATLDAHFPARRLRAAYVETLEGLGVRAGRQENVLLDDAERPTRSARPAAFAVRAPEDVRLSFKKTEGGASVFRELFREAARAQHFAWASRDAAARHPEFIHAPANATPEGHAALFAGLFRDPAWLASAGTFPRADDVHTAARRFALTDLYEARRLCALARYALSFWEAGDARSEQLANEYAALLTEATGFRHDAATSLSDADEAVRASERLRARLFASSLAEHLRSRHGRRWFDSRAAGGELVDVWNTASRYDVEELARLAWGGTLDFDLLAETLTTAVGGG
ncbi:MAG TPA: hypothetical protein VFX96_14680 [Pyrinomonadaceae bacterium]|nr:hypothetical protein [Pyrinomonadaceae bacterium]